MVITVGVLNVIDSSVRDDGVEWPVLVMIANRCGVCRVACSCDDCGPVWCVCVVCVFVCAVCAKCVH